ncbi:MAG: tetratricopeptide repeat protein [Deltaproteobacteria bacterium]|nr:tetratricopeptide repeat protein [Deltaproteobacteria bacterium]
MVEEKVRKRRSKSNRAAWIAGILFVIALGVAWWFWNCIYDVSPTLDYVLIEKNKQQLKLLSGETLHVYPHEPVKILKIATNICFNRGIRLSAVGFDVNALLYESISFATLLPQRDIFKQYKFRVTVMHYDRAIGYIDIILEPRVEDWLDKANKIIDDTRRLKLLEKALRLAPNDRRIKDRLVSEYIAQRKWKKAASLLEEIFSEEPDQQILYSLLEIYESMPDRNGVVFTLRRILEINPDDLEMRLKLASVLESSGNITRAIREYEELAKRMAKEDRLPIYKTLGYLYTEKGEIAKAIENYLKALEMDKKDPNLYYNLSYLYEKAGRGERADFFLAKAVRIRPDDVDGMLKLAGRLIRKGRYREAKKYLSRVLKKRPDSVEALLLKLKIAERQKDKKTQKQVYRKILALDPKNETVIYNLGVLEYETGNLEGSRKYLERFARIHPDDYEVHTFLFDIYNRLGKQDLAYKEVRRLIRLRPKEIAPYGFVFEYLSSRNDHRELIEVMKRGLRTNPNSIVLMEYLVVSYLKTGEEGLAIEQMKKILALRPRDTDLMLKMAKLQEKIGKIEDAIETYEKVLSVSKGHGEAKSEYVRLLSIVAERQESQEKYVQALETYRKILEISPEDEKAQEAYLRLRFKVLPGGK